ncbi:LLM class flavin-dependent oxidoreductase [Evansella cellulosilytica]|nr:LLM class flavin-dependent oxidoreductase [Evansella cellulosilytica]
MKLSILDQSPISTNQTVHQALQASLTVAQSAEKYGYTRYWIAEHHDLGGLACSAPEIMLSYIGAQTKSIRIGSGAILLPHYKPYKVAEISNMLATLFPGRIDIGIGRAPGGSAEVTNALSTNFLQQVYDMPKSLEALLHYVYNVFSEENKPVAAPIPDIAPHVWLLGTSKKSAQLAAKQGLPYAFGQFMTDNDGRGIINEYIQTFNIQKHNEKPYTILTISAICAETTEKAFEQASSSLIWSIQKARGEGQEGVPSIEKATKISLSLEEKDTVKKMQANMVIGNRKEVAEKLRDIKKMYQADEIMIVTITHSLEDKLKSYELIANELL